MQTSPKAIAIFLSDIHFSHNPPACRSEESNWYQAMRAPFEHLHAYYPDVSWFISGDIFDRWNSPPELINFAHSCLLHNRPTYMIPGQHDMPFHSQEDYLGSSAYGTLVRCTNMVHLFQKDKVRAHPNFSYTVSGFGWEHPIPSNIDCDIVLLHRYIHKGKSNLPNPKESHVARVFEELKKFKYAFVGDNHQPFLVEKKGSVVINCGSFMRRSIDQAEQPKSNAYALFSDGKVTRVDIPVPGEKFSTNVNAVENPSYSNLDSVLESLKDISQDQEIDQMVDWFLKKVQASKRVKEVFRDIFKTASDL